MTGANVFEVEVGEFDQLVILSPSAVTDDEVARIREAWAEAGERNKPVVMAGFRLGIIRNIHRPAGQSEK